MPDETEKFYAVKNLPSVLGSNALKSCVKDAFSNLLFTHEVHDFLELACSPEQISVLVCNYFDIPKEQLYSSKRGKEKLHRGLAIFLIREHTRETLAVVDKYFDIGKYSTVSSAIERVKARAQVEQMVQSHLEALRKKLQLSTDHLHQDN